MTLLSITDIDTAHKTVLVREDFNVPMSNGKITDTTRIDAAIETIQKLLASNAKIILMSHLGRPTEGEFDEQYSLKPVADYLTMKLQQTVTLEKDWLTDIEWKSSCVLAENVRFLKGENSNNAELAKQMAARCDVFVMDAFAVAHRSQSSTVGVAKYAKTVCAGPLLLKEINALETVLSAPKRPVLAIIGGSKVSTKLSLLKRLSGLVDQIIVGGGIANTFLKAAGYNIGKSLYEEDQIPTAKDLLNEFKHLPLPRDVITSTSLSEKSLAQEKRINDVASTEMILDIGSRTIDDFSQLINAAETIIWNGPVGVFEYEQFANGTKQLAQAVANSSAYTLAGGGDTIAAINQSHVAAKISYISTGGGAFLSYLQGLPLPAIEILQQRCQSQGVNHGETTY